MICWQRNSPLGVLAFLVFVNFVHSAPSGQTNVCDTNSCKLAAEFLLSNMNESANYCDNFYEFGCGGWIEKHPIPAILTDYSAMKEGELKIIHRITDILRSPPSDEDTEPLKQAKDMFKMCSDTDTLNADGTKTLEKYVQEFGGWPMIESTVGSNVDNSLTWQEVFNRISKRRDSTNLIVVQVGPDDKNTKSNIIMVNEPFFALGRHVMFNAQKHQDKLTIYEDFIVNVAEALIRSTNAEVASEQIRRDAKDIIAFETALAGIASPINDLMDVDKTYNLMTIDELQRTYNSENPLDNAKIDWLKLLKSIISPAGVEIDGSEKVVVGALKFIKKLPRVLETATSRTIVNFLQWHFVRNTLTYTNSELNNIRYDTFKKLGLLKSPPSTTVKCVSANKLHTAISYEYSKKYFMDETKSITLNIFNDIKKVVKKQITDSTWMDEETKVVSIDKLEHVRAFVGYPDWYSHDAINKYYKDLEIQSNYLDSALSVYRFDFNKEIKHLREPVDKDDWGVEPTEVNAFYTPTSNAIILTAAFLQEPMFYTNQPYFMHYATIGFVIGHEISHAFDNNGRKFDKEGNAKLWWTNKTIENYNKKTECMVNQFNQYEFPELKVLNKSVHVDGELSAGENMGDSAGFVAAYAAFKEYLKTTDLSNLKLPGLEKYNVDQLFFISAVNLLCESHRPTEIELRASSDPHPTGPLRVRGGFSNIKEFGPTFGCALGTVMNPEAKCTLWT